MAVRGINQMRPARPTPWHAIAFICFWWAGECGSSEFRPEGRDAFGRSVDVLKTEIAVRKDQFVPYPGTAAITRREFPDGFPRSMGSGLCLKGTHPHGWDFWVLGDRGPNGDGPEVNGHDAKIFPAPGFSPAFGVADLSNGATSVVKLTAVQGASGLPGAPGTSNGSDEVALSEPLRLIAPDPRGIDPEAIACGSGKLWIAEEYGPSVLEIDPASGRIVQRFIPGEGLPAVFARRRVNRGIEAMTYDAQSGTLVGTLQSPIDDGVVTVQGRTIKVKNAAPFIRWVELHPETRRLRQFAYPISGSDYEEGKTGNAKLGDIAALGGGRFVVIEEGKHASGNFTNRLYLVDIADATDIQALSGSDLERSAITGQPVGAANWQAVKPLRKRLLVDLRSLAWEAEKAEGLALVDERTLALTNDNDYGFESALFDANGIHRIPGKVEHCRAVGDGHPIFGDRCPRGARTVALVRLPQSAARQHLWLLRFERPLRDMD